MTFTATQALPTGPYAPVGTGTPGPDMAKVVAALQELRNAGLALTTDIPAAGSGGTLPIKFVAPGTDLIQSALNNYEGLVVLQKGVHLINTPITQNRRQKVIGEGGGATIVRANAAMAAVWQIGNGAPSDRTHLSDLSLDANGLAGYGLDLNVVGTTGNTNGEPDAQMHIERLYIDDATDKGVWLRGSDSQAWHLYGCRVRRAGNYGIHIQAPDGWITDCEATTTVNGGAGFMVEGANGHYKGNKAWYCRGYGWNIKGTRNIFVDCESQDTQQHGWYVQWDKNIIVGCSADTAGYSDVGGTAGTADGFYLETGLVKVILANCMSFDRQPAGVAAQQRYGFNMSASTYNIGRTTNASTAAAGTGTTPPVIGPLMGGDTTTASFKNVSGLLNLR